MATIRIAVGSKRVPKLDAVREALEALGPLLHPKANFDVRGYEIATGVSHTPRSRAELMAGASGRCEALMRLERGRHPGARHQLFPAAGHQQDAPQRAGQDAVAPSKKSSYFIGLEGGLDVVYENGHENSRRLVFLEGGLSFVTQAGAASTGDRVRSLCLRRSQLKCWTEAWSFPRRLRHTWE